MTTDVFPALVILSFKNYVSEGIQGCILNLIVFRSQDYNL